MEKIEATNKTTNTTISYNEQLQKALNENNYEEAKSLVKNNHKCDVNLESQYTRKTLLLLATECQDIDLVQLLLEITEIKINHQDHKGYSPIILACERGNQIILEELLKREASIDSQTNKGKTALMIAAKNGNEVILKMLLDHGANIELKDITGKTALMIAAKNGNEVILEMLLDHGANIELKDKKGRTASDYAKERNNSSIVTKLSEYDSISGSWCCQALRKEQKQRTV